MIDGCPNLSNSDNKALIAVIGEREFYRAWMEHDGEIPQTLFDNPKDSHYYENYVGLNAFEKAYNSTTKLLEGAVPNPNQETENIAAMQEWWDKTFKGVPLDTNYQSMIVEGGHKYMAIFNGAMVALSQKAAKGTTYHEAFHVATQLYLNETERKEIYEEARKQYGSLLTDRMVEELLADKFMNYMLKKTPIKEQGLIQKLLTALMNWVEYVLGNKNSIDYLFSRIENGSFKKKPTKEALRFAEGLKMPKVITSKNFDIEVITYMGNVLIDTKNNIEFEGQDKVLNLRGNLKSRLNQRFEQETHQEIKANLKSVLDNFDDYFEAAKNFLNKRFGIEVIETSEDINDLEINKAFDDTARFKENYKDTMPFLIKKLFMTTYQLAEDTDVNNLKIGKNGQYDYDYAKDVYLGQAKYIDYETVLPFVTRLLVGSTSFQNMMEKLDIAIDFEPSLIQIKHKILNNPTLEAAFWTTFNMQNPNVEVVLKSFEDGSVVLKSDDGSNMTKPHIKLANSWSQNIQINQGNNLYTLEYKRGIREKFAEINKTEDLTELATALNDLMNLMGLNTSKDLLTRVLRSKLLARKTTGTESDAKRVYKKFFEPYLTKINLINQNEFNDLGNLNSIASILVNFNYELNNNSYLNVNGDVVYSMIKPNFLSEFFKPFIAVKGDLATNADKQLLLQKLTEFANEPAMKESNWLFGTNGLLNKKADGTYELNEQGLKNFSYALNGGMKDTIQNEGFEYDKMSDKDWALNKVFHYLKDIDKNLITIPILTPSDSGVTYNIQSQRFKADYKDGKLTKESPLFKALVKSVNQEISRIEEASKLLFNVDKGRLGVKDTVNMVKLQKFYHWKEQGVLTRKGVEKNGEIPTHDYPTGEVFNFQNMLIINPDNTTKTLNDVKVTIGNTSISLNELIYRGLYSESLHKPLIEKFIEEFVEFTVKETKEELAEIAEDGSLNTIKGFKTLNSDLNKLATEIGLNTFISQVEMQNFLLGLSSEYKNSIDVNKRAKQIISPGNGILTKNPTFKSASISDIKLQSDSFIDIINGVATSLKLSKTYKVKTVDVELIKSKSEGKDKSSPLNDLEQDVYNIVNKYASINSTDGQGYITLDRYEEILKGLGKFDKTYETLFEALRKQEDELEKTGKIETKLSFQQLEKVLEPIKGFYYNRAYDSYSNRFISTQVKYSTVPLVPQLVAGTQLADIARMMKTKKLDELIYESAEKVGITHIAKITDKTGKLVKGFENLIVGKDLSNSYWRVQQDNPNHLMDYESTVGTQLARLVIDNLQGEYSLNGKSYKGDELINHYMQLVAANIADDFKALASRLGIEKVNDSWKITNLDMVQEALLQEIKDRGLGENFEDALQYVNKDTKEFKLPLFVSSLSKKYESIILSFFDSNIRKRKQYGGLAVMFSNAHTEKKSLDTVENPNGIEWLDSYVKEHGTKLKMATIEDGKITEIPCLLPAHSKKFFETEKEFDKDGKVTGYKYTNRVDINKLALENPDILSLIGYRIPTETKHSMIVLKIVGFLPQESGATIVLPNEVITQSGADFDIDKMFLLSYAFTKNKEGFSKIEYIEGTDLASVEKRFNIYVNKSKALAKQRAAINLKYRLEVKKLKEDKEKDMASFKTDIAEFRKSLIGVEGVEKSEKVFDFIKSNGFKNLMEAVELAEEDLTSLATLRAELVQDRETYINQGMEDQANAITEKIAQAEIAMKDAMAKLSDFKEIESSIEVQKDSKEFQQKKETREAAKKKYKELFNEKKNQKLSEINSLISLEDFSSRSVEEQNIELARQNRTLDVFRSILQNPLHYGEVIAPNSFDKFSEVKEKQDELNFRSSSHLNPLSFRGQNYFRKVNIQGRGLKGMAVNAKGFTTVGQVANMKLRNNLGFVFGYTENLEEIRKRYDGNVLKDGGTYVIVNHTDIGKAPDGSYVSSNGTLITDNLGSIVANILDIVKEGLPDNVNSYTFDTFAAMLMTGVEPDMASWFIGQPIMQTLSQVYFSKKGLLNEDDNKAIQDTKNLYLRELARILSFQKQVRLKQLYTNKKDPMTGKLIPIKASNGGEVMEMYFESKIDGVSTEEKVIIIKDPDNSVNFPRNFTKNGKKINLFETLFGIKSESVFSPTLKDLKSDYEKSLKYGLTKIRSSHTNDLSKLTEEELKEKANILRRQVQLLETYNRRYKKAGEAIKDGIKATAFDRTSVGPTFSKMMGIEDLIDRLRGSYDTIEKTKAEDEGGELSEKSKIQANARILINDSSFVEAIYPKKFGLPEKSAYPLLEVFYEYAFKSALDSFQNQFINTANSWRNFKSDLYSLTGLKRTDAMDNKIDDFLHYQLSIGFKNFRKEDFVRILGTKNLPTPKDPSTVTLEEFKDLSAAQQVWVLKARLKENLTEDTYHILNLLQPELKPTIYGEKNRIIYKGDFDRKGIHNIKTEVSSNNFLADDFIKDSFAEMLSSSDDFIRTTAESLLDFAFVTNGLQFKAGSFAKYIPNNYLSEIGYGEYLKKKADEILSNNFAFSPLTDRFILNNSNDTSLVPVVYTEYEQGSQDEDGNPKIVGETSKNPKIDWNKTKEGILAVPKSLVEKEGVAKAKYIRVKKGFGSLLYKRVNGSEYGVESSTTIYYIPVNDISDRYYTNPFDESLNDSKNTDVDFDLALNKVKEWVSINLSNPPNISEPFLNIKEVVNHSGGANGADSQWDIIGKEFGMVNNKHYYHGNRTPKGNTPINDKELEEGISRVRNTYNVLQRPDVSKYYSLHGRNWFQVKNSEAVFAISHILEQKEIDKKGYINKALKSVVEGGTGYAVEMAIQAEKVVYVFNQTESNKSLFPKYKIGWYKWDSNNNDFVPIETPVLTKNFAGIGTREINEVGKQAIRDVYEKTLQQIKQQSRRPFGSEETLSEYEEKKQALIAKFAEVGQEVTVIEDFTLEGAGQIQMENGKVVIRVNPNNMMGDTIFHEFGHLLVDSLGFESELVRAGITQLRDEDLWQEVKELYPDLTEEQLAKEVLTTAIGMEADKLWRTESQKSNWRLWLENFFRKVAKLFGVEESAAKQLARQLVTQNLDKTIKVKLSNYRQDQRTQVTIKSLNWNNKFLEDAIIDIQTLIRTKTQSLDIEVLKELKQLVEDMLVKDELKSLNAYAIWVTKNVNNLQKQFNNYEGMTWNSFKLLDEAGQRNFVRFMKEANDFLYHVKKIDGLEFVDDKAAVAGLDGTYRQTLIKTLKDIEPITSDMANKWFKLSQNFSIKYLELSSSPEFGGRGKVKNVEKWLSPQMDESFIQLHLDALFDTNHPLVANLIKNYNYVMFTASNVQKEHIDKWNEMVEKASKAGVNINEFVQEDGKILQEIDYHAFFKARYEFFKDLFSKTDSDTEMFQDAASKWFRDNTKPKAKAEMEKIAKEKRAYMTTKEYEDWKKTVMKTYFDPIRGTTTITYMNEFSQPNPDIYKSSKFLSLVGKEGSRTEQQKAAKEFYDYLTQELNYLVEHTQESIVKKGYIPAINNMNIEGFGGAAEYVLNQFGFRDKKDPSTQGAFNAEGELVRMIPFRYNQLLGNQEKLETIPEDATEETIKDIRKRNNEIKKRNKEEHGKAIVKDLNIVMPTFIKEAIKHKYKSELENEMLIVKEQLKQSEIVRTNGVGAIVTNALSSRVTGKDARVETIKGENSNVYEHLDMWMKMVFYGDFSLDEGKLQQLTDILKNYTSFRGLGFNYLAGANNYLFGKIMTLNEAVGNQFFGVKAFGKAITEFNKALPDYIASYIGDEKASSTNKTAAIIDFFDVMQTSDEFEVNGNKTKAVLDRFFMFRNVAFFQQHIGEFTVQNQSLLAMLFDSRVIDGTIMNYKEYLFSLYEKEGVEAIDSKSIKVFNKDIVTKRETIRKKAKEDFAKMPSLYESIEFVNGKLDFSKLGLKENELAEFKNKIIGVNQYLHGIYNKDDASTLQHYALGRLAMQFRKWMRPGWNRRFGSRFGENYWNERRAHEDEGSYVTTAKFLFSPLVENFQVMEGGKFVGHKAIAKMFEGYKDLITNASVHWESMSESQKANIRRTTGEVLMMITIATIGYALNNLRDEDDDENPFLNWLIYAQQRLWLDHITYTPVYGWFNEGEKLLRSPAAGVGVLKDAVKVLADIFNYPFETDDDREFKSGIYHGKNKLEVHTKKLIPLINQIQRIKNFENEVRYYRAF